ncbi:MAG TPA: tRNA-uridine aminocarboxypropyltransferase [Stellaceae bacterium]|nr:tRNA-uridine aminocarboxypropyltransferase [Stellaceae bacterium]
MPDPDTPNAIARTSAAVCARCGKPGQLCVCGDIAPLDNRIALLILQHPQEQDRELGTARLTLLHLKHATMKVGLSWPSLAKALGREVDPKRWAVLYLGAASAATLPKGRELTLLDSKGVPAAAQDRALAAIEGIVALDGSWSQAKTLWWRNAWVLKCRRLALNPKQPSRYGKLRREPRREGLSTLEAAGLALSRLGGQPEIERAMLSSFARLLDAYRSEGKRPK